MDLRFKLRDMRRLGGRKADLARFLSKIDFTRTPAGCWLWRGALSRYGYGSFSLRGRTRSAHRIAFALSSEEEDVGGLLVCHKCDTPACVNPDHLFLGTALDNMADSAAKLKLCRGERHRSAKIDEALVLKIRALRAGGKSDGKKWAYAAIGRHFNLGKMLVYRVCRGETWRQVPLTRVGQYTTAPVPCIDQCQGSGVIPVYRSERRLVLQELWKEKEAEHPSSTGWHFVRCPTCKGVGALPRTVRRLRKIAAVPREKSSAPIETSTLKVIGHE